MWWPIQSLVEVTKLITCGVAKRPNYVDFGIPFLSAKNVKNGKIIWKDHKFISREDHTELTKNNKPLRGDILYTRVGSFGEAAVVDSDNEFSVFVSLTLIKPKHDILSNTYLKYYLNSEKVKQLAKSSISGSGVGNLNVGTVRKFPIPLPSIPEQKRIVTILDQAFAEIDKARANAEQNLKNARELFDSYLQQVFSQRGEGWVEETLGQATGGVYTGPFGSLLHKSDYIENGIPLVNPAHITETGISVDKNKTVSLGVAERLSSYIMREGDIVIGRRGEMGRCALVTEKEDGFLCGTGSFFIKLSSRCYGGYLVRYLRSASCRAKLETIAGGAVMPNLSNKDLSSFVLYLPSFERQKELAAEIAVVAMRTRNVADVYETKLNSLDELKKSLLQKAFSGELTQSKG